MTFGTAGAVEPGGPGSERADLKVRPYISAGDTSSVRRAYFVLQGLGLHPVASGSFLKSEVVMYGRVR